MVAAASVCALVIVIALSSPAFGSTKVSLTVVEHATSDAVVDIGGRRARCGCTATSGDDMVGRCQFAFKIVLP